MIRKLSIALCIAVVLSLAGSGWVTASRGLPTWGTVFDPGSYMLGPYHLIQVVEVFKGDLYTVAGDPQWFGEEERVSAAQIFRSRDGKVWKPASEIGFGLGAVEDQCGMNYYDTAWDMQVFEGQLYMTAYDSCFTRPGRILRSADGRNWETVATTQQMGSEWNCGTSCFGQFLKMGVYKGMLYTSYNVYDPEADMVTSFILRSPNGNPESWEKVKEFPQWYSPGSFFEFKGALYLASDTIYAPGWLGLPDQIWRTVDGVNWEVVVADGFGNPGSDSMGAFAAFQDYLYVGEGVYEEGYAGQIWRSRDGVKWEPVIMDGFGNPLDIKVDGLIVYNGYLYAYTVNWTEGASVYRTKDAVTWERVNEPGWGNPLNAASHLSSGQAIFKGELYMGQIGPQGMLVKMVKPRR